MPEGKALFEASLQCGQTAIADIFNDDTARENSDLKLWLDFINKNASVWPTRYGLRLSFEQAIQLPKEFYENNLGTLILVGNKFSAKCRQSIYAWRKRGITVCWEYSPEVHIGSNAALFDALIIRGYESGGITQNRSLKTLFSLAKSDTKKIPLIIQGADSPELAAVFLLLGASGFILDSSLLRLPQFNVSVSVNKSICEPLLSSWRRESRTNDWIDVHYEVSTDSGTETIKLGPNTSLCSDTKADNPGQLAANFRQSVNATLSRILTNNTDNLGTQQGVPFLIQGPMACISNNVKFAESCSKAGFFPVLSLTDLSKKEVFALGNTICQQTNQLDYGLGITGNTDYDLQDLIESFKERPPATLILSADQWPNRDKWSQMTPATTTDSFGCTSPQEADFTVIPSLSRDLKALVMREIPRQARNDSKDFYRITLTQPKESVIPATWLHIQNIDMLDKSLDEGYKHFIIEGCESGGHVGLFSSTVLWTTTLQHLRDKCKTTDDIHLILAGGVHDAKSILFGMLLADAFDFAGQISFQLGTPLLFSKEAIASGAIHSNYQKTLCQSNITIVPQSKTGSGLRTVDLKSNAISQNEEIASPDSERSVFAAYRNAITGNTNGLFLAGESIAHFASPLPLQKLSDNLNNYQQEWQESITKPILLDTLDFRSIQSSPQMDIAVVGLGGIFPDAKNTEQFWNNIKNNQRKIKEVPPEHWGPGDYRTDKRVDKDSEFEKTYSWFAGQVDNFTFDQFDCLKYHFSPNALKSADKIHLMLLKAVAQAVDSAGADFILPKERTAVIIGNSMGGERVKNGPLRTHLPGIIAMLENIDEFNNLETETRNRVIDQIKKQIRERIPETTEDSLVGGATSTLAGRVAGYLNVYGGNFAVDAACASSLAALAMGAELLNSDSCDTVVVGGVDCDLSIDTFISFSALQALSQSISKPFMKGSDGFTMGEGSGVVLLKRLDKALADGNIIYARICSVGMSSDGKAGSLTIPSEDGQLRSVQRAFDQSGFAPETIGFIEAHGTGTPIGDATELSLLNNVFADLPPGSIALGTIKSHIGHLKSAAGIASLIKTVLALHNKTIPPAWIEGEPHPMLQDPKTPLKLLPKAQKWQRKGFIPRRAAISSFGFGGSNFHVHLEEMNDKARHLTSSRLLLFSGENEQELTDKISAFNNAVSENGFFDFNDPQQLRYLGGTGSCRMAAVWNISDPWPRMMIRMQNAIAGATDDSISFTKTSQKKKIAFMFPGQGSITPDSFCEYYNTVASFAHDIKTASRILQTDLAGVIWPPNPQSISRAEYTRNHNLQPATTAVSLALANMLQKLGIMPDAVAGHSLGFYSALAAARVLTTKDILKLVHKRALCFNSLKQNDNGGMIVLRADEQETRKLIDKCPVTLYAANFNSPYQTVISLKNSDIEQAAKFFDDLEIEYQTLQVGWGFHSPLVAPAAETFNDYLKDLPFRQPCCPLYSETTGELIDPKTFDNCHPDWLSWHITHTVEFVKTVKTLYAYGYDTFIELGARGALSRMIRDNLSEASVQCLTMDSSSGNNVDQLNNILAQLYVEAGTPIDFGEYLNLVPGHLNAIRTSRIINKNSLHDTTSIESENTSSPNTHNSSDLTDVPQNIKEVFTTLQTIVAKHTGFKKELLSKDQLLQEGLGIDSLKLIDIVLEIEKFFKIRVPGSGIPQSVTLGELANLIAKQSKLSEDIQPEQIERYALTLREVPSTASNVDIVNIGLLAYDQNLCDAWKENGYGPSSCITKSSSSGIKEAVSCLSPHDLNGIIYAVEDDTFINRPATAVQHTFLPAYYIAHDILPEIAKNNASHKNPYRFLTASYGKHIGIAGSLSAFTHSLQWDFSEISFGHVTINENCNIESLVQYIKQEISDKETPYRFTRYVDSKRHVEHLEPEPINGESAYVINNNDVILVTGGAHGITAEILFDISETVTPTWIITGSTDLDTNSPHADNANKTITKLRELGCSVHYLRCDFSDLKNVSQLAKTIEKSMPNLTGVIHGAGIIADAKIDKKTKKDFLRVINIKAGSALAMQKMLDSEFFNKIRFWVNFSSIASFFGNAGQTDYAAANAFLNIQANEILKGKIPFTKSILWSPWSNLGMASGDRMKELMKSRGIAIISPEDGVRFFKDELTSNIPVAAYCGTPTSFAPSGQIAPASIWTEKRTAGASTMFVSRLLGCDQPFFKDHIINNTPVLPAVMALELGTSVLHANQTDRPLLFENFVIHNMTKLTNENMKIALTRTSIDEHSSLFEGSEFGQRTDIAFSGIIRWNVDSPKNIKHPQHGKIIKTLSSANLYGEKGLLFSGPLFQVLNNDVKVYENTAQADLCNNSLPVYKENIQSSGLPIALIDGLLQMANLYCTSHNLGNYLPTGIDHLWWSGIECNDSTLEATVWPSGEKDGNTITFNARIESKNETLILFENLTMTQVQTA